MKATFLFVGLASLLLAISVSARADDPSPIGTACTSTARCEASAWCASSQMKGLGICTQRTLPNFQSSCTSTEQCTTDSTCQNGMCTLYPGSSQSFTFAHISDTQPMEKDPNTDYTYVVNKEDLKRVVRTAIALRNLKNDPPTIVLSGVYTARQDNGNLNNMTSSITLDPPAFVLMTGDISDVTQKGTFDIVDGALSNSDLPIMYVLGNHDNYNPVQGQDYVDDIVSKLDGYTGSLPGFALVGQPFEIGTCKKVGSQAERIGSPDLAYGFVYGGVLFAGIANDDRDDVWTDDDCRLYHLRSSAWYLLNSTGTGGYVPLPELSWWGNPGILMPRILFMHYPIECGKPPCAKSDERSSYMDRILSSTDTLAVLDGHTHVPEASLAPDGVVNQHGMRPREFTAGDAELADKFWIYKTFPFMKYAMLACPVKVQTDGTPSINGSDCIIY